MDLAVDFFPILRTYYGRNPMAETAPCTPSQADGSRSIAVVTYKAVVQAVLLFGSETWKLSPASLKSLEGFHIRAAR